MATILNDFFASVFTAENYITVQPLDIKRIENILNGILIAENDVLCTIKKVKVNKYSSWARQNYS